MTKHIRLRSLYVGKLGKNALRVLVVVFAVLIPVFLHSAVKTYFFEPKARSACEKYDAKFDGLRNSSPYKGYHFKVSGKPSLDRVAGITNGALIKFARSSGNFDFVPNGVDCDRGSSLDPGQDRFIAVGITYFSSNVAVDAAIGLILNLLTMLLLLAEVILVIYLVLGTLSTKPARVKKNAR